MSILYFLLTILLIVLIHEVGHFLAAKVFGVYVKEFAIGFGPTILKFQGKETKYSLRILPLGGFVAMAGEEGVDIESIDPKRTINGVNRIKRIIIMLSGIIMNLFLSLVLFCSIYIIQPKIVVSPPAIINTVVEGSPADIAGLKSGDLITTVVVDNDNKIEVKDFFHLQTILNENTETFFFEITRGDQEMTLNVHPKFNDELQRYIIGISALEPTYKILSITQAIGEGFSLMGEASKSIGTFFLELFQGKGLENLGGPVGIYQVTDEYASAGIVPFMYLLAFLSLNVAFFNLLPLPILDGGRVVLVIIEAIFNRPINKKIESGLMLISMALLFMLIIYASYNDITRLFN